MISKLTIHTRNLVENPYFVDSSAWVEDPSPTSTWTINSAFNRADFVGNLTQAEALVQEILKTGRKYRVYFTITNYSGAGQFHIRAGTTLSVPFVANGSYTVDIVSNGTEFGLRGNSIFNGSLSKISVLEFPGTFDLDLSDDVNAALTFNVADVRNPSKRNSSYSKTIVLPGSKQNSLAFNSAFEIGGDGLFNPNKKINCIISQDSIEVFKGILQLKNINRIQNGLDNYHAVSYECVVFGRVADIFYSLGDTKLEDLDFSEYNHLYDKDHIINSWGGYISNSMIKINGVDTLNWTTSAPFTVTVRADDGTGRIKLTTSAAHGFVEGDQVYYRSQCPEDIGDHIVKEVPTTTTVVLHHPFQAGFIPTTENIYKRTPKGKGYVYPMVQFANNHGSSQAFLPYFVANTYAQQSWSVEDFQPAIYVREYLSKIFNKAGFTWQSNFFDSALFKRLVTVSGGNGFLRMSDAEIASRSFKVGVSPSTPVVISVPKPGSMGLGYSTIYNDETTFPNQDASNLYNIGAAKFTVGKTGWYNLRTNAKFNFHCTNAGGYTAASVNIAIFVEDLQLAFPQSLQHYGFIYHLQGGVPLTPLTTTGIDIDTRYQTPNTPTANPLQYNPIPAATKIFLTAGNQFRIRMRPYVNLTGGGGAETITITFKPGSYFAAEAADVNLIEGSTVNLSTVVPKDVYCKDFLNSIIKMFNLYVEASKDNDKLLIIEPRDDFYAQGATRDWTKKLDVSKNMLIQPMGELNAKEYIYTHKEGSDFYNKEYKKKFPNAQPANYGDYRQITDNDFISGKNETTIIFPPTMLDEVRLSTAVNPNVSTGRILSQVVDIDLVSPTATTPSGIVPKTVQGGLRLLYFNLAGSSSTWQLRYNNTNAAVAFQQYPAATHLDHVAEPTFDLNFGFPAGFVILSSYIFDSWTDGNLFNIYHKRMLDEITSKDSKIVSADFFLLPTDIAKLDFRDRILVDGHYFRLNKIIDYSLSAFATTRVELLKAAYIPKFIKKKKSLGGGIGIGVPFPPIGVGNPNNPTGRQTNQMPNLINGGQTNTLQTISNLPSLDAVEGLPVEPPIPPGADSQLIDGGIDNVFGSGSKFAVVVDAGEAVPHIGIPIDNNIEI